MAAAVTRKATSRVVRHVLKNLGGRALDKVRDTADAARERAGGGLSAHVRRIPIQRSIDIGVPIEVVWDEWMALESLPEGMHRVVDIERDGDDVLVGRLSGLRIERDWEAEILDERDCQSFAWRSYAGSDCAGLATFHHLATSLTRIELQLDVVPTRIGEAAGLAVHLADHRAETELRAFKARVETIDPDQYPPLDDEEADTDEEIDE
jgi:uncharacterized membrane protein